MHFFTVWIILNRKNVVWLYACCLAGLFVSLKSLYCDKQFEKIRWTCKNSPRNVGVVVKHRVALFMYHGVGSPLSPNWWIDFDDLYAYQCFIQGPSGVNLPKNLRGTRTGLSPSNESKFCNNSSAHHGIFVTHWNHPKLGRQMHVKYIAE